MSGSIPQRGAPPMLKPAGGSPAPAMTPKPAAPSVPVAQPTQKAAPSVPQNAPSAQAGDKFSSFVAKLSPAAEKVSKAMRVPVEAVLAQWAYESGYGESQLSKNSNNFGGIKAGKDWKGRVVQMITREKDRSETEMAKFRAYNSPEEYADDYLNLMGHSRYAGVSGAGDTRDFAMRLGKAGYHQDTPSKYADALEQIAKRLAPIYAGRKKTGIA